jgi:hypothetical protein
MRERQQSPQTDRLSRKFAAPRNKVRFGQIGQLKF